MPVKLIIAAFLVAFSRTSFADAPPIPIKVESSDFPGPNKKWPTIQVTVPLDSFDLAIKTAEKGANLSDLRDRNTLVAINGAYFDPKFAPLAWLKDTSREYHKRSRSDRGGIFAVKNGLGYLGVASNLKETPDFVVQNFPLLVLSPGMSGMRGDDGRRAARTVICAKDIDSTNRTKNITLIAVLTQPGEGPTLFELAEKLVKPLEKSGFGCAAALNLDGGPSTGIWLAPELAMSARDARGPLTMIGHAININRKVK